MAHLLLFGHSECVAPPLFPSAQRHEEGCHGHPRPVHPIDPSREAYQDATGRVLGEIAGMDVDPASRVGTEDPEGARLAAGWAGPHGVLNLVITDRKALVALKAFEDRQREVPPLEPASGPLGSGLVGHHGQVNRVAMKQEHRSEEHTSELQSRLHLVCRLLLEKKKKTQALPYPVHLYGVSPHNLP